MQIVHQRCCGLDVHKRSITACLLTARGRETRTFGTMTRDLLALGDWLIAEGVTHVAMESTGVFWKPVHNVLEASGLTLLVVNAQHVKAVPGRETDVKDAEWLAELLRHGLLRASFIPDRAQRELRELVRQRTQLIREHGRALQRIEKLLEGANIKIAAVASEMTGESVREMLRALADGVSDAATMADLARGRLRRKREELAAALAGQVGAHQRLLLQSGLCHVDFREAEIAGLDAEVARRLRPFEEELELLDGIPGFARRNAECLLAEIGPMSVASRVIAIWPRGPGSVRD
jgi:transposase